MGCPEGGRRRLHGEDMELQFGAWLKAGSSGRRVEKGWERMKGESLEKRGSGQWWKEGWGREARKAKRESNNKLGEDSLNEMDGNSVSYASNFNEHIPNGPHFLLEK
jgi:hypothetical protein